MHCSIANCFTSMIHDSISYFPSTLSRGRLGYCFPTVCTCMFCIQTLRYQNQPSNKSRMHIMFFATRSPSNKYNGGALHLLGSQHTSVSRPRMLITVRSSLTSTPHGVVRWEWFPCKYTHTYLENFPHFYGRKATFVLYPNWSIWEIAKQTRLFWQVFVVVSYVIQRTGMLWKGLSTRFINQPFLDRDATNSDRAASPKEVFHQPRHGGLELTLK